MSPKTRERFAPIEGPSAWTGESLRDDPSWAITLEDAQRNELRRTLECACESGLSLLEIERDVFPLPNCQPLFAEIARALRTGRGFVLLRGFPIEGLSREELENLYWGFCSHLGTGVTQNSDATLIHYVNEGRLRPNQGTRGVGDPGLVSLHVDLADVVSLLCVRQAADSPRSRLSSAATLHNRLAERNPAGLARLYEGFVWDRQNEHDPAESPTTDYRVPMFSEKNGQVSCRYNRNWMVKALERRGECLRDADRVLLDEVDAINHETCVEFDFGPGDIQFANNYTVLHGRAPHTPARSEEETRLLLRIWFNMEGVREFEDEAIVRHGILKHGKLGWTARELAAGLDGRLHPRRASDGAPACE